MTDVIQNNKTGGDQYSIYLDIDLVRRVDDMAQREQRSRSNMIAVLLQEALNTRELQMRLFEIPTAMPQT